jgi:hypothetical protein
LFVSVPVSETETAPVITPAFSIAPDPDMFTSVETRLPLLEIANVPAETLVDVRPGVVTPRVGWLPVPVFMTASSAAAGVPPVQLLAVFQSVSVAPVQVCAFATPAMIIAVTSAVLANKSAQVEPRVPTLVFGVVTFVKWLALLMLYLLGC